MTFEDLIPAYLRHPHLWHHQSACPPLTRPLQRRDALLIRLTHHWIETADDRHDIG